MAGKIVDVFSPNLIRDADYASLSSWTVEGTPTGAEGRLNLKKGDRVEQTFMFSTDEESEGISGFYFSGNTISNGTTPNTDATVTAIVQYNDGSDEAVVILVTPTQSSNYFSHKFGVTETEELYPVSGKVIIEAHGEASIGVLGFYMNYGIEIKEIEKPGIPPNLLKNTSFEKGLVKKAIPSWSGDAVLSNKAHPLNYDGMTDEWSLMLEGNSYIQYEESVPVSGSVIVLSWYTVGNGAKFELVGNDGSVLYRGNVGSWEVSSQEWLRQYAVISPRHFGKATDVSVRFIGSGGVAYLDGIKLEESDFDETMAAFTEWIPHEDDLEEEDFGDFWLKSFKVGTTEHIGEFTDEGIKGVDANVDLTTVAVAVPYHALNESIGLSIELAPGVKAKHGRFMIGTAAAGFTEYALDDAALTSMVFPAEHGQIVAAVLTDVPMEDYDYRFHLCQIYAVTFDDSIKQSITSFVLGGVEYINEAGIMFHNDYSPLWSDKWPGLITVEIPYTVDGEHVGLALEFEDESILRVVSVYDMYDGGYGRSNYIARREAFLTETFPWGYKGLVIEVETVNAVFQYYGVRFVKDQGPKMLKSFTLGGTELIDEPGIVLEEPGDDTNYITYQVPFNDPDQYKGITLALAPEYSGYNINMSMYTNTGDNNVDDYNNLKDFIKDAPLPVLYDAIYMQYLIVNIIDTDNNVVQSYGLEFVYDSGGDGVNSDYVIEAARAQYYEGIEFMFSKPYAGVLSVNVSLGYLGWQGSHAEFTLGASGSELPNVYYEIMYGGDPAPWMALSPYARSRSNAIGVRVTSNYSVGEYDDSWEVSMQAVVTDIPQETNE